MANARRVLFNLLTFVPGALSLPGVQARLRKRSIGAVASSSARYCYSVWLRHLRMAADTGLATRARAVAELGPGASLGVGLAALLCGADEYHAFDVVQHTESERNLRVLEELIELYRARTAIPEDREFPQLRPQLKSYAFPHDVLDEATLSVALAPERIQRIRHSLRNVGSATSMIRYQAPWTDESVVQENSVDVVFSQAVLEHVDDLTGAYHAMWRWLKPGGFMSHTIDFRSHGWSTRWDGHWGYSELAWRLIRGRDVWSINREPYSTHRRLIEAQGFRLVSEQRTRCPAATARSSLAPRFRDMPEEDRATRGVFVQAVKSPGA
ncbi:MAG TPA: methyltransferase domain-containing protein [Steroidobacteraceae bacterium]|jgi:SAM-dependent methyltransferase